MFPYSSTYRMYKCSRIRIRGSIWGDCKLNGRGGRDTQLGKEEAAGDGEGLEVHDVACLIWLFDYLNFMRDRFEFENAFFDYFICSKFVHSELGS